MDLIKTVVGALLGAGIGAFTASRLARRFKLRDELLDELRKTKSAMTISFTVCNSYINLKEQHISKLKSKLDELQKLLSDIGQLEPEKRKKEVTVRLDLEAISPLDTPVAALQNIVVEKMGASSRIVALAVMLRQVAKSLDDTIVVRNTLIADRLKAVNYSNREAIAWYAGVPNNEGHVDNRYAGSVSAIYALTDDCIAFSSLLCEALAEHGAELKKQINLNNRSDIAVTAPDFKQAHDKGIMPDLDIYKDWRNNFVKASPEKVSVIKRLRSWSKTQ